MQLAVVVVVVVVMMMMMMEEQLTSPTLVSYARLQVCDNQGSPTPEVAVQCNASALT